jgi:hypothetical protein
LNGCEPAPVAPAPTPKPETKAPSKVVLV